MNWLEKWNAAVSGLLVPLALMITGGYFLLALRGVWMHPVHLIKRMLAPTHGSGTTPLKAMSLSLAGVLGVGNLVGVAGAIIYGGAGAVFWMWVSATLAMLLKYAEVVLALGHRRRCGDGWQGGAMYYMEDTFPKKRVGRRWGRAFALLLLLDAVCMGGMIQVNAVSTAIRAQWALSPVLIGVVVALVIWLLGMRGEGRVVALAQQLVPWMTLGFCLLTLWGLFRRAGDVPGVLGDIVRAGLHPGDADQGGRGILGGVLSFLGSRALRFGTMRGLLSNEAGCGSSPMAHADADTVDAVAQGGMGILEVFVDTHLLCTGTALIILLAFQGRALPDATPMMVTLLAFEQLLGKGARIFLCASVCCFGLATVLCWSHYMQRAGVYLMPRQSGKRVARMLLLLYCSMIVVGACYASELVWQLADFAIGGMTLVNLYFLWKNRQEIRRVSQGLQRGSDLP
ncbi:MAG: alanine:cation symporter family protein [Clostridia bacterium]|nr:alanine:cation symporter family protein [Clostridia bacterium]